MVVWHGAASAAPFRVYLIPCRARCVCLAMMRLRRSSADRPSLSNSSNICLASSVRRTPSTAEIFSQAARPIVTRATAFLGERLDGIFAGFIQGENTRWLGGLSCLVKEFFRFFCRMTRISDLICHGQILTETFAQACKCIKNGLSRVAAALDHDIMKL